MDDYTETLLRRYDFEPGNMSRIWAIDHWQFMIGMLTAATWTKMDTAKTFQVYTTVSPCYISVQSYKNI